MSESAFKFDGSESISEVLRNLDHWAGISRGGPSRRLPTRASDLWDILSALRGPDMQTAGDVKNESTAIIRRFTLPTLTGRAIIAPMATRTIALRLLEDEEYLYASGYFVDQPHHFLSHIRYAASALAMSWLVDEEEAYEEQARREQEAATRINRMGNEE